MMNSLKYGIEYAGVLHYDFELRLPMVADNIAVLQQEGAGSNLRVRIALFARCLLSLGSIPQEAITTDLLAEGLVDDDFDVLSEAEAALKKKRLRPNPPWPTTDSPALSLADTASPSPASSS